MKQIRHAIAFAVCVAGAIACNALHQDGSWLACGAIWFGFHLL